MIQVKICGLSTPDAVAAAVRGGAAMIGFVFHPPSPRHVREETAAALAAPLAAPRAVNAGDVRTVAVTVDASDEALDRIADTLNPDIFQLHGRESPERVRAVRERMNRPVMKSVPVQDADDVDAAVNYFKVADMILFDTAPAVGGPPGGSGRSFDWTVLGGKAPPMPWMLSGGLTPDNIAEAVGVTDAPFVDVSSGVEEAPGKKNADRIAGFMRAVDRLNRAAS